MSNTGKRNKRVIVVFSSSGVSDGIGGFTKGVGTEKTVWASVRQLSMSEQLAYGLEQSTATYIFGFNYNAVRGIGYDDSVKYEGKEFRILSVKNINESDVNIDVIANMRK